MDYELKLLSEIIEHVRNLDDISQSNINEWNQRNDDKLKYPKELVRYTMKKYFEAIDDEENTSNEKYR